MRPAAAIPALLLLIFLFGCGQEPAHPGILVVAKPGDAVKLDPADITDAQSAQITQNIFDNLVEYEDGGTRIKPALALSWTSSPDGRIWTFHLRPHVRFHDGTPFTSRAVVFSFQRQMDRNHPFHAHGQFIYWQTMWGGYPGLIRKVRALDPLTVRFELAHPIAPFLANLAMFPFAINSEAAVRKWGPDYFKHPVGTGPFRFVLWQERERVVLDANPDYWGGKPRIDRLVFQPVADDTSRKLQLERGVIDFMTGVHPEDVGELRANPDLRLLSAPGMNVAYLAMNCQKAPFNQRLVRQAIRHAINKERILRQLYQGLAISAVNPMPPMMLGYEPTLNDYAYDPEQSRELLRQAGFPNGFSAWLWYPPISRDYMSQPKAVAEAVQSDLWQVGIRAKLLTFDWGTYLNKLEEGEHEMALFGWVGDNGDPDNFLYALLDQDNAQKPAQNVAFYLSRPVHRLLLAAQKIIEPEKRARLYREAQRLIYRDSPWVPMAHADQTVAFRRQVSGFRLHPTAMIRFRSVEMK